MEVLIIKMLSCIKNLCKSIVDLILSHFKPKEKPKTKEEYVVDKQLEDDQPITIKQILLDASADELLFMAKLIQKKNEPIRTKLDLRQYNRKIKYRGIRCLYVFEDEDKYYNHSLHTVFIDNKVFRKFKRQYKKHGFSRLTQAQQKKLVQN